MAAFNLNQQQTPSQSCTEIWAHTKMGRGSAGVTSGRVWHGVVCFQSHNYTRDTSDKEQKQFAVSSQPNFRRLVHNHGTKQDCTINRNTIEIAIWPSVITKDWFHYYINTQFCVEWFRIKRLLAYSQSDCVCSSYQELFIILCSQNSKHFWLHSFPTEI